MLFEHGATVNAKDRGDRTVLHAAALRGHMDVIRTLYEHGADLNSWDYRGWTPLDYASDFEHKGAETLLRELGGITGKRKQDKQYDPHSPPPEFPGGQYNGY